MPTNNAFVALGERHGHLDEYRQCSLLGRFLLTTFLVLHSGTVVAVSSQTFEGNVVTVAPTQHASTE
jgi:hypothetical protein